VRRCNCCSFGVLVKQSRRSFWAFEESRDIEGQGGRGIDPGKLAGKCHRNKPPMGTSHVNGSQARLKWCGKSAPASR